MCILHGLWMIFIVFLKIFSNQARFDYRKYANDNRGYYCFQVPFLPWMWLSNNENNLNSKLS